MPPFTIKRAQTFKDPDARKPTWPTLENPAQLQTQELASHQHSTGGDAKELCRLVQADFFANLAPDEKELFQATTIAEQVLSEVRDFEVAHKDASVSRRFSQKLKPFVAGVVQYGQALDVMSNSSANVLCPLWGGIRVVLHPHVEIKLANEFGAYFENIASMLEQMGFNISRMKRYPRLYPENQRLKEALVHIYRLVFEFCTRALHVFREGNKKKSSIRLRTFDSVGLRSLLKLAWKPFKEQFGDVQSGLAFYVDVVELEVQAAEREEASAEREKAELERQVQSFRWDKADRTREKIEFFLDEHNVTKLNEWLTPVDVQSSHARATKLRHSGTGNWFLNGSSFNDWLRSPQSSLLWVHAIPGGGKTILVSAIINYLKENVQSPSAGLAYFYCDYSSLQTKSPTRLLCTLLAQLASQNKYVFAATQAFFQKQVAENPAYRATFDEVKGQFGSFVGKSMREVFIVVDGLDECEDRECILGALKELGTGNDHCGGFATAIKVLVASRNITEISRAYGEGPTVGIMQEDVASDIESYISAEVNRRIREKKLKLRGPALEHEITSTLSGKSAGMFQWAKCQIDTLTSLKTDKAIRGALSQLPKTLDDTYIRILQRIEVEREDEVECVRRILGWLVNGLRTLTTEELAECISINVDAEDDEECPSCMDFDAVITDPEDILDLCSSLVTFSPETSRVSLAHYSVKEFLTSERMQKAMPKFYVGDRAVESQLARTCLTYLCFQDFSGGALSDPESFRDLTSKYKFLQYASQSWGSHAHAHGDDDQRLLDLIMGLFKPAHSRKQNYKLWMQVFQHCRGSRPNSYVALPTEMNPLHYAAVFGLAHTIGKLLETSSNLAEDHDEHGKALKTASLAGHVDVVKVLLDGCPRLAKDKPLLNKALYAAASKGRAAVVTLLLANPVIDIEAKGKEGTSLQVAALDGHKDVVKALLEHGSSHSVSSGRYGAPLAAAAEKGHQRTVELLLYHGADVDGQGGWFRYPLISAIVGGSEHIIHTLIEHGANINALGGRHGSPLMAAAGLGNCALAGMLIDKGAEVNDYNDKGGDALHSASVSGHAEIVRLLLARGADPNAKGGKHHNALNAASASGHDDIVRILLENGAEPATFDEYYGTSLAVAAFCGHEDIVRTLHGTGVDPNAEGGVIGTALVAAAGSGHGNIVSALFELGVRPGRNSNVRNALVTAAMRNRESVVRLLVSSGANINSFGQHSGKGRWTPLQIAAFKGHHSMVKLLLDLGADIGTSGGVRGSALMAAIDGDKGNTFERVVDILLEKADVNKEVRSDEESYGMPIAAAAAVGSMSVLKKLLDHGADADVDPDDDYCTPLWFAAKEDNEAMVDLLISNGADINHEDLKSNPNYSIKSSTPLQAAAEHGKTHIVRKLVALGARLSIDDTGRDPYYKSALQAAAHRGHVETVSVLLELGSDPSELGGYFGTPLQAAAEGGHVNVLKALLDAGASIDEVHVGYFGSALIAAAFGGTEPTEFLVERGASLNISGSKDYPTALHAAAKTGNDELVKYLIEAGADVNFNGGEYCTALQAAAAHGQDSIVDALIAAGADVNAVGGRHYTALQACYTSGFYIVKSSLISAGADVNIAGGGEQWTALHQALDKSCLTLVYDILFRRGADIHQQGGYYGNALQHAIVARDHEKTAADFLIELGADINARGGHYGTVLNAAIRKSEWEGRVAQLLELGADVNLTAPNGSTKNFNAIHAACQATEFDTIKLLISKGADPNVRGGFWGTSLQAAAATFQDDIVTDVARYLVEEAGVKVETPELPPVGNTGTPLLASLRWGPKKLVRYFLEQEGDLQRKGGLHGTAIQYAMVGLMKADKKMVKQLVDRGADPLAKGGRYGSALHFAALEGKLSIVLYLLKCGADVNGRAGKYGYALQSAVVGGHLNVVRVLVKRGADVNATGGFYRTALQAAAILGRTEILIFLVKSGAVAEKMERTFGNFNKYQYDQADENLAIARQELQDEENRGESEKGEGNGEDEGEEEEGEEGEEEEEDDWELDTDVETDGEDKDSKSQEYEDNGGVEGESSPDHPGQNSVTDSEQKVSARVSVENTGRQSGEGKVEPGYMLDWVQVKCGPDGDLGGQSD